MPKNRPILTCTNDWESLDYRINGLRVKTLTEVKIGRKKYVVKSRQVSVPYSDMGQTYNGVSIHYFIHLPIADHFITVDMNDLPKGLMIVPTKYTVIE